MYACRDFERVIFDSEIFGRKTKNLLTYTFARIQARADEWRKGKKRKGEKKKKKEKSLAHYLRVPFFRYRKVSR